jgi:hypothetical protein
MKKLFFTAMCVFMTLSANKAAGQIVTSGTTGSCTWTLTGTAPNYTITISGTGSMADYNYYYNVPWYSYGNNIKTLNIQQGVSYIGSYAFYYCSGLTSISIPQSVTSIGGWAFGSCINLTGTLTIPNSITAIGNNAFSNCYNLTSVIIPNSITTIGSYAFSGCSGLTSVTIPNSVTTIGSYAFAYCEGLTSIIIPNSVTAIKEHTFRDCTGLTSITIPNSITTIGYFAFAYCNGLTSVTIPNSVIAIEDNAFRYCTGLTSVTISNSVRFIGGYAFEECSSLTEITSLNSVPQNIDFNAFSDVDQSICTLIVPTSAVSAYQNANVWKNFATITGGGILFSAKTTAVALGTVTANLPDGLYTANTSVNLTATALSSSFLGWTSRNTNLGNTNSLSFVLTQDTVITANFGNVDSIHLTTEGTLKNQSNLTNITHLTLSGNIDARDIQFIRDSMPLLMVLDLTNATIVAYSGTEGTHYGNSHTYLDNEMPIYSFFYTNLGTGNHTLTSVALPHSVMSIGQYAFDHCSGLTSITIPDSVTSIGQAAFSGCSSLTSITIPDSVTSIGDNAFSGCSSLTSVTIPNSVTSIGDGAFRYCSGLSSITIPNSITSIGYSAFKSCTGLTSVTIPNSVTSIGQAAFDGCSGLTSITIPNSVTSIGEWAFFYCSGLTEIYVKAMNPPTLGYDVFYNVSTSIPVYIPCGTANVYQSTSWNYFNNMIEDFLFDITLQSNDSTMGITAITQAATCTNNSTVIIEATPYTGYRFLQWTDGNTVNPRTITVLSDTTFVAEFEVVYHVTLSVNDTTMGTVSGEGDYAFNTTLSMEAIPNIGYRFVQWTDGDTVNPRTITVLSDTSFTAEFEAIIYHVTISANDPVMGTVTGDGDHAYNTTPNIEAIPHTGYRFVQWTDGDTENPRNITVLSDTSFTAIFDVETSIESINKHSIKIYPNPATDNLQIILPNEEHAIFILYDMQGKMLIKQEVRKEEIISVDNLASGMYIYKVRTDKQNYQGKMIIKN